MDRAEWMYKIPRAGNDLTFLHHVPKFIADAKKHRMKPSQPSPSPPGGPSDNDNAGGSGSNPRRSLPPYMSIPQGDTGGAPGNETLPPTSQMGTGQCPPAPKKPTDEADDKPAHLTIEEWAASCIAEDFTCTTAFDR